MLTDLKLFSDLYTDGCSSRGLIFKYVIYRDHFCSALVLMSVLIFS